MNQTATFSYRAWDETTGTASSYGSTSTASTASNGGTTAFSSNTASASVNIIDGIPAVHETFTSESSLGISWTVGGNASSIPNSTNGVVLTTNNFSQAGYIINNIPFKVQTGIDVKFTYDMPYGGADGISFFLIKGTTTLDGTFSMGPYGGGLGYKGDGTFGNIGITNGILGLGLDEFGGGFANSGGAQAIAMYGPTVGGANTQLSNIDGLGGNYVETTVTGSERLAEIILLYSATTSDYHITFKLDGFTIISDYELSTLGITAR